ncbi:IS110 family transposase [Cyclobacterium sp.]|uniref:IS110 family transposase n=1 Tax=Cyclobacterium sp. TaxID=1966343 RepID=UPI001984DAFE|nr:IS110 family transposase [Cyclobacterium sp.]MBD3627973.1 IS110 family transposase [Cyclobacterium sp.]
MQTQCNKNDFSSQNIYVGIDVHLKSWKVTVMMDSLFKVTFSQNPCPQTLYNYLVKNFPGANYFSAYEAGFSGYWTHHNLCALGIKSIVVNPADIPTTAKEKVQKEDARDSQKIARSLKNGELLPIYIPSLASLGHRGLIRLRKATVNDTTRVKNRIKASLHFNGISIPAEINTPKWNRKLVKWLTELELEQAYRQIIDTQLSTLAHLRQSTLNITKQLKSLSKTEQYEQDTGLLISISGIGLISALTILTELESMDRFNSLDKLCSFIGLVPSTNSSGDTERTGNITPRGHKVLRSALIECAWVAARTDPALAKSYNQYCKRMKANQAITRIAKKLLSRIRYVLINKQPYVLGVIK